MRLPGRPRYRPSIACASLLACALGVTGCEVGPNYRAPVTPAGAGYSAAPLPDRIAGSAIAGGDAQALALGRDISGQWWTLFRAPALNRLIDQALQHNPSLRAAQASLRQARELERAQAGTLFPAISAAFGIDHQKQSTALFGSGFGGGAGGAGFGPTGPFDLYNATVSVSYGVDLWGGARRGVEQAAAQVDYQRNVLEATYLALTANIVAAAVVEASLAAQIGATQDVIAAEKNGLRVVQAQLDAGAVTRADVLQQQAQLQTTLATLPPLQSQLAQERNLLATYVGAMPNQFIDPGFDLATLTLPAELPVSLPSNLVSQRPDIRQSAANLHVQTAAVGVATANMLPQIALSGSYGGQALKLGTLFASGSIAYSLAAQLTQKLFEGGTLIHQRRAAVAAMQAAAAQYQSTVIAAFSNVSDALLALQYDATALQVALDAAHSASESLKLLQVQLRAGSINTLSVLTAEQTAQNALIVLARARAARYADTVALFQALGGGWWNRTDVDAKTDRCCGLLQ